MSTIIAAYNSEGCVGRCDGKCYNATSPKCRCICGGKNHGKGAQQAVQNNHELLRIEGMRLEAQLPLVLQWPT